VSKFNQRIQVSSSNIIMAVRIAMLAALAVSAQAGYLRDLKEETAPKSRVVKTFQFPATLLVNGRHPTWLVDLASTLTVPVFDR
jgi:hypothetical protein